MKNQEKASIFPLRAVAVALALLLLLFLLPLLLLPGERTVPEPVATLPVPEADPDALLAVPGWDEGEELRLLHADGTVERLSMADYLWGVVAAEMPASFHAEALRAQAVCARTYCVFQRQGAGEKHSGADVCTDHTCCQAYLTHAQAEAQWGADARRWSDKIAAAVADTDGLLCLYEGQPIDAVFFSSSAGRTSDAVDVWGTSVPYLTGVDSPEGTEVPGWQTMVTVDLAEFTQKLTAAAPQADLSAPPEQWFTDLTTDTAGAVTSVKVGGASLSGAAARELFGLRSTHFTAAADGEKVTFWVTGYGHGVGLSQYGANALAGEGKRFWEILEWYYTGAQVGPWTGEGK